MLSQSFCVSVQEKITDEINKAINLSKEYNFDIIGIYNIFNNKFNQKWKQFLNSLENPQDYIQKLAITVDVKMDSKF